MYIIKGQGALIERVLTGHDHCLKKPVRILPEMPSKLNGSIKVLSLQVHSSNAQKLCSSSESYLKITGIQYERQRQMKLEATRRCALILGFTTVFEVLPVDTILFRPQFMNLLAKANENSFPLDDFGGAGAEIVLQGSPFTARLSRPGMITSEEELEEVLTVKLKVFRQKASAFHVFINLPTANEQTPVTSLEFAGTFFHEPRRVKSPEFEFQETTFRIGIGELVRDLGLIDQPDILVTFVPRGVDKEVPVVLESVNINLE